MNAVVCGAVVAATSSFQQSIAQCCDLDLFPTSSRPLARFNASWPLMKALWLVACLYERECVHRAFCEVHTPLGSSSSSMAVGLTDGSAPNTSSHLTNSSVSTHFGRACPLTSMESYAALYFVLMLESLSLQDLMLKVSLMTLCHRASHDHTLPLSTILASSLEGMLAVTPAIQKVDGLKSPPNPCWAVWGQLAALLAGWLLPGTWPALLLCNGIPAAWPTSAKTCPMIDHNIRATASRSSLLHR